MTELRVLIAAAGRGSRASLPYPKTLYPVRGVPILLRLMSVFKTYDASPTVIVSPSGADQIRECLVSRGYDVNLVLQPEPLGMGDAVLRFQVSPAFSAAKHVLLVWGDIPFVQRKTVAGMVRSHFEHDNDFTFATRWADSAYTVVSRDRDRNVRSIIETREAGIQDPRAGEREIGLFVFRKFPVFKLLQEPLPNRLGQETQEHGFLYVVEHLVKRGFRVEGIKNATELDLVSLNRISDVKDYD